MITVRAPLLQQGFFTGESYAERDAAGRRRGFPDLPAPATPFGWP